MSAAQRTTKRRSGPRRLSWSSWAWAAAVILAAFAVPAAAQEAEPLDRVHLLDEPPYEGRVSHFNADASGKMYLVLETGGGDFVVLARDRLAAIEFKAGEARELPENTGGRDLIVQRDGRTLAQDVTIIVRDHVVIEGAMLDRETVAAIVFRPMTWAVEAGALQPCPKDRRLGGWIKLEFDKFLHGDSCKSRVEATAWFPLTHWNFMDQARPPWPLVLERLEASGLTYEISLGRCADLPGDEEHCSAPAAELAGSAPMGVSGTHSSAASGQLHFRPLHPELTISFPRDARVSARYRCTSPGGHGRGSNTVALSKVIIGPGWPDRIKEAPNLDVLLGREPGPCAPGEADRPADCISRPDRYAVIPFSGSATVRADILGVAEYVPEAELSYEICCGCGENPKELAAQREREREAEWDTGPPRGGTRGREEIHLE